MRLGTSNEFSKPSTTDRQKQLHTIEGLVLQAGRVRQEHRLTQGFLWPFKPKQGLSSAAANRGQISADAHRKGMGGIDHPAKRALLLQHRCDSTGFTKCTNREASKRNRLVSLGRSWCHHTHVHAPAVLLENPSKSGAIPSACKQPNGTLVNRGAVHQDVRRQRRDP